jgi:hypothetical protein
MENVDKLVKARLAEGVDSAAIVQELQENDDYVAAVLANYVNGLVPVERSEHHSFRFTRRVR